MSEVVVPDWLITGSIGVGDGDSVGVAKLAASGVGLVESVGEGDGDSVGVAVGESVGVGVSVGAGLSVGVASWA